MASIPFVKASACGNDFLIISIDHAPDDIAGFSCHICDRHNGVGADGVEWVMPASDADLGIHLINADGSDAEISGNGTRCVAAWYCSEHGQDSVSIHTDAGVKTCELKARIGNTFEFRTAMGKPEVGGERTVKLRDRVLNGITVSMGNPHFVVFVPEFEDGWQTWAGDASVHPDFPRGTNVELVRAVNEHATIAFVPYGNLANAGAATKLYRCKLGMVACHRVGEVVELLPGEVTFKHPRRDKMVRGQMVVMRLDPDETAAAEDDVLFVGGAPLFL